VSRRASAARASRSTSPAKRCASSAALVVGPPVEVARPGHAEAVEERPGVVRGRRLEPPGPHVGVEGEHVAGGDVGVQPQLVHAEHEVVARQVAPQRVERLVEGAARRLGLGVGPEQREQLLARDPPIARPRDERDQRQAARLRRGAVGAHPVAGDRQPAEGPDEERGRHAIPSTVPGDGTDTGCHPGGRRRREAWAWEREVRDSRRPTVGRAAAPFDGCKMRAGFQHRITCITSHHLEGTCSASLAETSTEVRV
jgi:hypothetical protein